MSLPSLSESSQMAALQSTYRELSPTATDEGMDIVPDSETQLFDAVIEDIDLDLNPDVPQEDQDYMLGDSSPLVQQKQSFVAQEDVEDDVMYDDEDTALEATHGEDLMIDEHLNDAIPDDPSTNTEATAFHPSAGFLLDDQPVQYGNENTSTNATPMLHSGEYLYSTRIDVQEESQTDHVRYNNHESPSNRDGTNDEPNSREARAEDAIFEQEASKNIEDNTEDKNEETGVEDRIHDTLSTDLANESSIDDGRNNGHQKNALQETREASVLSARLGTEQIKVTRDVTSSIQDQQKDQQKDQQEDISETRETIHGRDGDIHEGEGLGKAQNTSNEQHLSEGDPDSQEAIYLQTPTISYLGDEMSLFPPAHDNTSSTYFLQDESLIERSIRDLLAALRDVLADSVTTEEDLDLYLPSLDLHLSEESKHTTFLSLSQLVRLHSQLQANEHAPNGSALHIELTIRQNVLSLVKELESSASQGASFSDLQLPIEKGTQQSDHDSIDQAAELKLKSVSDHTDFEEPDETSRSLKDNAATQTTTGDASEDANNEDEDAEIVSSIQETIRTGVGNEKHDEDKNPGAFANVAPISEPQVEPSVRTSSEITEPAEQDDSKGQVSETLSSRAHEHFHPASNELKNEPLEDEIIDYSDDERQEDEQEETNALRALTNSNDAFDIQEGALQRNMEEELKPVASGYVFEEDNGDNDPNQDYQNRAIQSNASIAKPSELSSDAQPKEDGEEDAPESGEDYLENEDAYYEGNDEENLGDDGENELHHDGDENHPDKYLNLDEEVDGDDEASPQSSKTLSNEDLQQDYREDNSTDHTLATHVHGADADISSSTFSTNLPSTLATEDAARADDYSSEYTEKEYSIQKANIKVLDHAEARPDTLEEAQAELLSAVHSRSALELQNAAETTSTTPSPESFDTLFDDSKANLGAISGIEIGLAKRTHDFEVEVPQPDDGPPKSKRVRST